MEEKGRVLEEAEAGLESGLSRLINVKYLIYRLLLVEEVLGIKDDDKNNGETDFNNI